MLALFAATKSVNHFELRNQRTKGVALLFAVNDAENNSMLPLESD